MSSLKVLIVEDNKADQFALTQLLIKFDYPSEVAASGESAISMVAKQDFAAILMDISLPGIDGFECSTQIRALQNEQGKHTPIIALSAWTGQDIHAKCLAAGMDDYVSKPVHLEHLRKVLLRQVYDPAAPNLKTLQPLTPDDVEEALKLQNPEDI